MGSIDFFAVARSVLLVGRVEGEENIRAVVQIKNNLAAFGHPKAFALSEDGFQWLGDYAITADEVDLCQYFGQKKSKDYAAFLSSSSSFC